MSIPDVPSKPVIVHLLSLTIPISVFLKTPSELSPAPLFTAKVARWIHAPESIDTDPLVSEGWDLLLIYPDTTQLPSLLQGHVRTAWSVTAKVSLDTIEKLAAANTQTLPDKTPEIPPVPTEDGQQRTSDEDVSLSITPELEAWSCSFAASSEGSKPVLMLSLLAYASKEKYLGYIKAFNEGSGTKYGGAAKMIGEVVAPRDDYEGKQHEASGWDDIALVQYPSIKHFVEMVKSEGYKEADRKWKVGSLKDTGLLCVVEVGLQDQQ